MLHALLNARWSDQHALHHALAAGVIEGRVVVSGNRGCGLSSRGSQEVRVKLGSVSFLLFFFDKRERIRETCS